MAGPETDWVEIAVPLLTILLVGVGIGLFLTRTAAHRREARHRRISAARRSANTSYDLFSAPEAVAGGEHSDRRRRRRRSSRPPAPTIDILPKAREGEVEAPPPGSAG